MYRFYFLLSIFCSLLYTQTLNETTSWLGNNFSGAGTHESGKWVQNFIDEIAVFDNGTVLTCSGWDENGRCSGLYKDGDVNSKLFQQPDGERQFSPFHCASRHL